MVKIRAGDREFPTLDSAIAYMGTLPPPVRLQAQELVAGSLEEMGAHFEDTVAKFWDYLESDGTMNELVTGRSGLRERFGYVKTEAGKLCAGHGGKDNGGSEETRRGREMRMHGTRRVGSRPGGRGGGGIELHPEYRAPLLPSEWIHRFVCSSREYACCPIRTKNSYRT